jgi:spore maturation protein CgeB
MVLPGNECSILVKSTHDALLCSEPKAANAKVQFDPEFFKEIQQPDSPDIAKSKSDGWEVSSPIKSHAKDVYERVKTFLIESKTPIMKDVVKNLSGLSYQLVKECFLKLCEENFLTRRGRR